nr:MAG TPA: hypothetical protein [Caudoviricetes sp.]
MNPQFFLTTNVAQVCSRVNVANNYTNVAARSC